MKFPKPFEQFLDLMTLLSEMLLSLEEGEQEYKSLLLEEVHKLEPYIRKSYPVISESYSITPEEAYELSQEFIKDIPRLSLQELQTFVNQSVSGELINEMFDNEEEEKQFLEDELHNLIAFFRVYTMNMLANNQYQTSVNQLVLNVVSGDEHSLFLAIKIEPLAEFIPTIADRISHAQMIGDTSFLEQLNKSRMASRDDKRKRNNRLNYFLIMFYRFGLLDKLTQPQIAEIFINRLALYDKDDSSLFKYIGRWKKEVKRSEIRRQNKLEKSKT